MKKYLVVFVFLFGFQIATGQETLSSIELEKLLDKAELQARKYKKTFRNLSAEETKTIFYFDKKGRLKERRALKSIFIVYQSPHSKEVSEFRNVLEFNGRNVQRSAKEAETFFKKVAKIKKSSKEKSKLKKEALRYDGMVKAWGMTLNQVRPFPKPFRDFFDFSVIGKRIVNQVNQNEVWVIKYKQKKTVSYLVANPTKFERKRNAKNGGMEWSTSVSRHFQPTHPLMIGEIWLDSKTAQIWRNEFKIVLNPYRLSKPIVSVKALFEYQSSDFGILVPKMFRIISNGIRGKDDKSLAITKLASITYSYSNFEQFKTDVDDYEIK